MARQTVLDPAAIDRLASQLAGHAALRVPAALSGQMQADAPQRSARVEYLKALLARDAGVFLERHGEHLSKQDLQLFEGLRADYEVDFLIRQLEQQQEGAKQHLTPQVRNRRLAQLNRLIEKGEFFSEAAMRGRQPLLHHQYVGQYQPAEPRAPRERDSHPLSASILTDIDEAATRARFDREQEAQDAVEAESSDEEYPEDRRAEVDQRDPSSAAHPDASNTGADSTAAADTVEPHQPADSDGIRVGSQHSGPTQSEPGSLRWGEARPQSETPVGALFDPPTSAAGRQALLDQLSGHQPNPEDDSENQPKMAPYVHIPEEERRQLADDFLQLMHQRFLAGDDEGVDYQKVDRVASLDEDWAAEQQQDAEDAYFDTVEG